MIKPEFPYKGNQIIVSSDRVTIHSKVDGVFLFGKATIGLSSIGSINIDTNEKLIINSPLIELGNKAKDEGEPLVLGKRLLLLLNDIVRELEVFCSITSKCNNDSVSGDLSIAAISLKNGIQKIKPLLNADNSSILSKTTYTVV